MHVAFGWLLLLVSLPVLAQARGDSRSQEPGEPTWEDHVTLTASDRVRFEGVRWFRPPGGVGRSDAHEYAFLGNRLRVGARVTFPLWQAVFELQDTRLVGLPDDANLPAPWGSLGPGALYYAHTADRNQGELFVKQGHLTLRRSGLAVTAGRFEISDGLETTPGDRTLATLKTTRIAERLVGPFGYTHVSRSFDAGRVVWDRPTWNATAFAGRPTRGGFEVSANRGIDDVVLGGVAVTGKRLPIDLPVDLRAFYLGYRDERDDPVIADNRPLAVRRLDRRSIEVHTVGAHALTAIGAGPGIVDLLAWGVVQAGDWGRQSHRAWAYALEAGYRFARLPATPWLRVGWNRSSGDSNPGDSEHETFFQVMPTARVYARFPFFNLMNNDDRFVSLSLEPHPLLNLRADYHQLRLSERSDLWYAGGGATNDEVFGFSGTPSRGSGDLAELVDIGVTAGPIWRLSLSVYYGHVFGGQVIRRTFSGEDADYVFTELTFKY
jgi:hypothetical protein